MKRFKFRLQKVLDYRHVLRKEKERELASRTFELISREERLEGILSEQDNCLPRAEELMTMGELMLEGEYKERLQNELEGQRELVVEAAGAVDEARDAYIEKAIDQEALETVRRRREEEHRKENARRQRKDLDELVVMRHRLKKDVQP